VKIVLISTYELGRQPFGLASPAAWLRKRGHNVVALDLSRQSLELPAIAGAELIAIHLPMHTATRLAAQLIPSLRTQVPGAHLCCYGLYAPMNAGYLRELGVSTILGGEFEEELVHLAERLAANGMRATTQPVESMISMARLHFEVPDRSGMPAMEKYAHLIIPGNGHRIVGSTEASRGCKHLCRHCPIVPVYKGVFRIVSRDVVLEDIRRQVAAGAQHITFGDPDFFNGIGHAMAIVQALHEEFPELTYDVTIKIEHLRKHERQLSKLRDTGCLFVTSAVESLDDEVLAKLDKGHTRADFIHVAKTFREIGLALQPTFIPFSPWTTFESYLDLLRALADFELSEAVAPVQLGIRLLIPAGSRLLELPDIQRIIQPFNEQALVYPWNHADPRIDELCDEVQQIVASSEKLKRSRASTFEKIWRAANDAANADAASSVPPVLASRATVPYLNEPWYC
jgi:radical SAM superfamily enzyme YgiQ (UPF0313 family)